VLRDGALIALGTHDSLLADSDVYARLWRLQHARAAATI
jgi:ABC-type multidrug transport system fused ATPase/permease subunit